MKRSIIVLGMALLFLSAFSSVPTQAADNVQVLVWSGNGAYHVEVEFLKGNATDWGYDVTTSEGEMNSSILEGIDILIVNGPDFVKTAEIDVIKTWTEAAEGRGLWIAGESDYGGYWYPQGLNSTFQGVNHIVVAIGGHIFVQDDAVNDAVMQDGAGYRPVPNTPNMEDPLAKLIMKGVENVTMHGPTAVIPYSSVTSAGLGTIADFNDLETATWLINTSVHGSVADQDFDDDAYWEGYPVGVNMSLTMAACEWDIGPNNSKLVVTGESMYADYKAMFGTETRYANNTALQNIQMTHNILDWFDGKIKVSAPGFEVLTAFIAIALLPAIVRRRKR